MVESFFKAKYIVRFSIRLLLLFLIVVFKVFKLVLVAAIVDGLAIKLVIWAVFELLVIFTVVCVCIVTSLWKDVVIVYVSILLLVKTIGV